MRMSIAILVLLALAGSVIAAPAGRRMMPSQPQSQMQPKAPPAQFGPVGETREALAEVNQVRALVGLPPFVFDSKLAAAAIAASRFRAFHLIHGHVPGGMGDFGFLPPGTHAVSAGCGALTPEWGWGTCCTYERYQYAGAAVTYGRDGRRFMHLFVSMRPSE